MQTNEIEILPHSQVLVAHHVDLHEAREVDVGRRVCKICLSCAPQSEDEDCIRLADKWLVNGYL